MRRVSNAVAAPLMGLLALAAWLRIAHLGRVSLYLDEAVTWENATRPTWLATIFAEPNHPPVWWVVTRAWIALFGDSEAALRMPAALLGIVAVALTYALARRIDRSAPTGTALLATALAALGGFWIEYAQEARMYSALLVEALGLSLLFLRWLERGRRRDLVAYCGLAVVALYTHYFALWPLLGHAACALVVARRRGGAAGRRVLVGVALSQVGAALVFLAWILPALAHPAGVSVGGRFDAASRLVYSLWRIAVGPALATLDRPRVDAGLVAFARMESGVIAVTALLWGAALALGAWSPRRRGEAAIFVATAFVVPLVGLLAIQSRLPLMHEKYLVFLAPIVVIVAARGAREAPGLLRPALTAGLLALSVIGVAAYHWPGAPFVDAVIVHGHPLGKEQWRDVQVRVAAHAGPGARVVLHPAYLEIPWRYYDRGRHAVDTLAAAPVDAAELARQVPGWANAPQVFWIFAHDQDADRERFLAAIAAGRGEPVAALTSRLELFPRQWGIRLLEESRPADPAASATPGRTRTAP